MVPDRGREKGQSYAKCCYGVTRAEADTGSRGPPVLASIGAMVSVRGSIRVKVGVRVRRLYLIDPDKIARSAGEGED